MLLRLPTQTTQMSIQNIEFGRITILTFASLFLILAQIGILASYGSEQSYEFVAKWGSTGVSDGEFRHPHGIDVDSFGNIHVTVRDNLEVQKFTSNGTFISKLESNTTRDGEYRELVIKEDDVPRYIFRSNVSRNGELLDPHGIDVDSFGNVFIADSVILNVQKFDANGKFITKWGTNGTGDGEFRHPHGIAHDSFDNVYVTDYTNSNVQKFDNNGKFITKWGTKGTGDGEFSKLECVEVDSFNNVYIADAGNQRIQKFYSYGKFLTKWGTNGTGDGEFRYPFGIATDSENNVFVSDKKNSEIQKFTPDGKFITKWGTKGTGDGEFRSPEDLAVDLEGNVYVMDSRNDRIQKFSPASERSENSS